MPIDICEDDDVGLSRDSDRNMPSCTAAASLCADATHGPVAQKNCRKTCGACASAPGIEQAILNDIELGIDDGQAVQGWTLTPKQSWTHTPTEDQACFPDPESFDCACHDR